MYSADTRSKILKLSDGAIIAGLNQQIDEAILKHSLDPEDLGRSSPENIPDFPNMLASDFEILELSELFKETGHSGLMDELYELSNGELTSDWIEIGKQANQFLNDYQWDSESLPPLLNGSLALD